MYLILRPLHSIANVTLYMFDLTQMKYISRFRPCVRYDRRRGEYTVDLSRWKMMRMMTYDDEDDDDEDDNDDDDDDDEDYDDNDDLI